ncbi:triose-phosphate isomerase [Amphibacillus sp. Q70]|uniref:triose-phosphate isomerase n=1 Tax=Amphibacillus sp. Q70 TaxID=3453416 RepID=UPI003F8281AB
MKKIYLNLKRFDIPAEYGGVNRLTTPQQWGEYIVKQTQSKLAEYDQGDVEFVMYLPEAHLIHAIGALDQTHSIKIGSQSVYRADTAKGGNFGAFTSNRTANAMKALGCTDTIIGHLEERIDKTGVLEAANIEAPDVVNRLLNQQIKTAIEAGLSVLYCVGEKESELDDWQNVLREQLEIGLAGVDKSRVTIAYEPVWAIGPGKTPPDRAYIEKIAHFIKQETDNLPVVYGGGLKEDNAKMLSSIAEIDGGLIALTRFQGEIGFYPDEYLAIIEKYLAHA